MYCFSFKIVNFGSQSKDARVSIKFASIKNLNRFLLTLFFFFLMANERCRLSIKRSSDSFGLPRSVHHFKHFDAVRVRVQTRKMALICILETVFSMKASVHLSVHTSAFHVN